MGYINHNVYREDARNFHNDCSNGDNFRDTSDIYTSNSGNIGGTIGSTGNDCKDEYRNKQSFLYSSGWIRGLV